MATYTLTDGQNETFNIVYPPRSQFDFGSNTINASGTATMTVNFGGQANNTINLASGARTTATITRSAIGTTTVNGDATATLIAAGTSELSGSDTTFNTAIDGTGAFHATSTRMDVFGTVGTGVTFLGGQSAQVFLEHPETFQGAVQLDGAVFEARGLDRPSDYTYADGALTIYGGGDDHQLASFRLADATPDTPLLFALSASGAVDVRDGTALLGGETVLPQHVAQPPVTQPDPQQPAPQIIAAHDNTTGADLPDTSSAYTGPVSGVSSQYMNITPDNLNIAAKADGLFIKTGAGDDAVALHGGTNVVDAGGGSNFLTGASGFDTFFLDARNIPAASSAAGPVPGAIWDTVQEFGVGDAVTLFGVGPGTAFAWQRDGGAAGHTGLTLHAIKPNGSAASLTLAGIDNGSHLQLSFGQTGGANYLYVKAV